MNIEITENIIRGSIIYALSQKFGNSYKYYDEEIVEGFEKPSFHVYRVNALNKKGYTGHNYKMENTSYRFVIKYFPSVADGVIGDINDKIDNLKEIFKYLEIINIVSEENEDHEMVDNIYSKANRINEITFTTSQGILLFEIQFDLRTVQYLEATKVEVNVLNEFVK